MLAERLVQAVGHVPLPEADAGAGRAGRAPRPAAARPHGPPPGRAAGHGGPGADPRPRRRAEPGAARSACAPTCRAWSCGRCTWTPRQLDQLLGGHAGVAEPAGGGRGAADPALLERLLRAMVAEGASDLHLAGGQRPRWRIDGDMREIADAPRLAPDAVLAPARPGAARAQPAGVRRLERHRLRPRHPRARPLPRQPVPRPRAASGRCSATSRPRSSASSSSACRRWSPASATSPRAWSWSPAPPAAASRPPSRPWSTASTAPARSTSSPSRTRSSSSTPRARRWSTSARSAPTPTSFARALRAALREDPDIVLVGEMRDLETVSMALETANTGHLVLGTLHTSTAVSTVERIVDLFPPEQQNGDPRDAGRRPQGGRVARTCCAARGAAGWRRSRSWSSTPRSPT